MCGDGSDLCKILFDWCRWMSVSEYFLIYRLFRKKTPSCVRFTLKVKYIYIFDELVVGHRTKEKGTQINLLLLVLENEINPKIQNTRLELMILICAKQQQQQQKLYKILFYQVAHFFLVQ